MKLLVEIFFGLIGSCKISISGGSVKISVWKSVTMTNIVTMMTVIYSSQFLYQYSNVYTGSAH